MSVFTAVFAAFPGSPHDCLFTHFVGLTSGIAPGKSSISNLLKGEHIPIVDADILACQVVEPSTPALSKITALFAPEVFQADGTLDRKKLGSVIFNDETKRKRLNSIVHPALRQVMLWGVLKHWILGSKYCIVDVPLLIEGGLWKWVGTVVVVYCSADVQLARLMQHCVIDNSDSLVDLKTHVNSLVQALDQQVGWTWRFSWLFPPWGLLSAMWMLTWRHLLQSTKLKT
ncbi:CoaE-domain-containing protein [Mycena maculata]|uniref:CoaE-domain-containing protein n=1 Tax=Mycena maculata TaxID=230809 RepID=A0AAD7IUZ6_9AGAR|nr:CoaE-domain-containing protein [Mycena maculata]